MNRFDFVKSISYGFYLQCNTADDEFIRGNYNASLNASRTALELLCDEYCLDTDQSSQVGEKAHSFIIKTQANDHLKSAIYSIVKFGSEGSHGKGSYSKAESTLNYLAHLFIWYGAEICNIQFDISDFDFKDIKYAKIYLSSKFKPVYDNTVLPRIVPVFDVPKAVNIEDQKTKEDIIKPTNSNSNTINNKSTISPAYDINPADKAYIKDIRAAKNAKRKAKKIESSDKRTVKSEKLALRRKVKEALLEQTKIKEQKALELKEKRKEQKQLDNIEREAKIRKNWEKAKESLDLHRTNSKLKDNFIEETDKDSTSVVQAVFSNILECEIKGNSDEALKLYNELPLSVRMAYFKAKEAENEKFIDEFIDLFNEDMYFRKQDHIECLKLTKKMFRVQLEILMPNIYTFRSVLQFSGDSFLVEKNNIPRQKLMKAVEDFKYVVKAYSTIADSSVFFDHRITNEVLWRLSQETAKIVVDVTNLSNLYYH